LERYYGRAYCPIPKTPRFFRFKDKILKHFLWASGLETHTDMTMAEYALHIWDIGPWVKDFVLTELDIVRGIYAHEAWQSEFCNCVY